MMMITTHRFPYVPVLNPTLAAILVISALGFGLAPAQSIAAESIGAASTDRLPEGLSTSDWSSIRGAYEAGRHAAFAAGGGYQARNPGQQWRTRFDGRGFLTTPDAGGWSWGLQLLSYGRAGAEQAVTAPSCVDADGGRVCYQWDEALTEWYINDRRGLEHGYTVHRRPLAEGVARASYVSSVPDALIRALSASAGFLRLGDRFLRLKNPALALRALNDAPLQLTLAVRGGLHARVGAGGRNVTFVNSAGAAVVNYRGLTVFDADGVALPAWFEASGEALVLSVADRGARYPLTIDPVAQQAYLKASNTDSGDQFGVKVAASGDTVVVGARLEDSSATGVGGNQSDNSASDSGAVYIFVRDAGGVWSQQAYLKASNTDAGDDFGVSVAASGDTVVVGACSERSSATGTGGNQSDDSASAAGAAYVFVRDAGGLWSQQAYLKASNTDAGDFFGLSVAVSGDTVVVGAPDESSSATGVNGDQADNTAFQSGAAYVFVRDAGGVWSQQAYLKASNTDSSDLFGGSVAASGDTVVVGADGEASIATGTGGIQADNGAFRAGAAYVFVRMGTTWNGQAYLKASNTDPSDEFGRSVAVSGDTVVVGAPFEDSIATGVDGNQADNSAPDAGAAYVFLRDVGGVWSQQAYLKALNTDTGDQFGRSVAASDDTVVAGARLEDSSATGVGGNQADNGAPDAGAAYVFLRAAGGVWSQQAYLKASNTDSLDRFGIGVAASGDTVVVGAFFEDSSATGVGGNQADNSAMTAGAAYVFLLPPDCNGNGLFDDTDIATGTSQDCNTNGIPDECELDSDGDGTIDDCDNCPADANADQADGDGNGVGDACEPIPPGQTTTDACGDGMCGMGSGMAMPMMLLGIGWIRRRRPRVRR